MGYETQWRDLRFRQRLFRITLIAGLPSVVTTVYFFREFGDWLVIAWLLGFLAVGMYLSSYRCPRCGDVFISRQPFDLMSNFNPFARRCLNCDLAEGDPGSGGLAAKMAEAFDRIGVMWWITVCAFIALGIWLVVQLFLIALGFN